MTYNPFLRVAQELGRKQEYFQGTGGNISLKHNSHDMVIKSSGIRVQDMVYDEGLIGVSFPNIRNCFAMGHMVSEEESNITIRDSVLVRDARRPSIETGFHAILHNAVIHSHSVYVNILACSSSFFELVEKLFSHTDIVYSVVEYAAPGHYLTQKVKQSISDIKSSKHIVFLKNHGVIASALSLFDAVTIHEKVNDIIRDYFGITDTYPISQLCHRQTGESVSVTPFLLDFLKNNSYYFVHIKEYMLFPDLIVFCKDLVVTDDESCDAKIVVSISRNEIRYNTSKKEAHIIEENLVAWAYILTMIEKHNLSPVFISQEQAGIIENLESEKYRKELVK